MYLDKPLDGVRVLEIGQYIAVPGAASLLAGLGAEVVKIEPPNGEVTRHLGAFGRSMVASYNRGKRSVALDLTSSGGRAAVERLAATSDILLQNMRPGRLGELGLGPEAVRAANPHLVYVSVSAFGSRGPSRDRAGYDIAAQAESGMMWITGEGGREPQRVGFSVVDAATTHAVTEAALAAYIKRLRSGQGEHVEVCLLDVAIHLQAINFSEYFLTGVPPVRRGNGLASVAPAADVVATRDGYIVLSAYRQERWAALCRLLGRPELIEDPRFVDNAARVAHRGELTAVFDAAFAHMPSQECASWLADNGIVVGVIRSYEEVRRAPDVVAGELIRRGPVVAGSEESEEYVAAPFTFGGERMSVDAAPPGVGEHTVSVLAECGLLPGEVQELLRSGAAVAPVESALPSS